MPLAERNEFRYDVDEERIVRTFRKKEKDRMITLDTLRAYGANVDEGLQRCMNMEAFYLRMVGLAKDSMKMNELKAALDSGKMDEAFELAHGMKGALLNVSLTPIARPMAELSDALKVGKDMDYGPLMEEILREWDRFVALF